MDAGVIYLLTFAPHAPRLVVSLASLRNHYAGPVTIYVSQDASVSMAKLIAADERLGPVELRSFPHATVRRNSTYLTKVELFNSELPYDSTVFLDADTLITGGIGKLFEETDRNQVCLTQFSNWMATQGIIVKRLKQWEKTALLQTAYPVEQFVAMVRNAMNCSIPAINVGILGIRRGAQVLPHWLKLASTGWSNFIADEISMQIIHREFPHSIVTDSYNYSTLYGYSLEPKIWHFHGDKHLIETQRNPLGADGGRWGRAFTEALDRNYGRISEWYSSCGDKALDNWKGSPR